MKKIPSYPKITAKTNITVTQTQNININSPKSIPIKKGFKSDLRKGKTGNLMTRNQSSGAVLKTQGRQQPTRKSSKKIIKDVEHEKSIKSSKSQRELALLSEKLKRLEEKIQIIKKKQKRTKNSSFSNRSLSKNKQLSSHTKKDNVSSRKNLQNFQKLPRNSSTKILKKSYSDKLGVRIPPNSKPAVKKSLQKKSNRDNQRSEVHNQEVLHQFLTQMPNSHNDVHLKQGVQSSLRHHTYEMSDSESQGSEKDEPYYIGKAQRSLVKPSLFAIRQHLFQSLQTLQFLQNISRPTTNEIAKKSRILPHSKFQHTVILDLDETLIHCNETLTLPHDVKLTIKFPTGQKIDAGVNIRPFARQFIQKLSSFAEVVVFTASHECYANVVLDYLDPHKKYISQRLFREHCWQTEEGIYIKDLRVLKNRRMENLVLVDNAAYSYYFQLQNGIPIIPFYDEKSDKQLEYLLTYLKQILQISKKQGISLRKVNAEYFQLCEYSKFQDISMLIGELYHKNISNSLYNNN